ncbi:hypothetical protein M409DRAFT_60199 [Zasmidium cellare ATCC 36951]|uniref:Uncharacterized protein n=1 Tax=Zasmidium cellare ATCC 36951 TaxID=1080233 RepID=A0A6A6C1E5_ZASCE|nr:uncharacterized protein M409DRAFT_60199 [Zasmidium cellare ATCC 36951]KAF2160088.1 hypothetical protein M409DRAFT_60199 [Zasmidium cellare ATCC 36951]
MSPLLNLLEPPPNSPASRLSPFNCPVPGSFSVRLCAETADDHRYVVKDERNGAEEGIGWRLGLAVDAWLVGFVVGRTWHSKATYVSLLAKYSFGIRRFLSSKQTSVDDSSTLKYTRAGLYNANMNGPTSRHPSELSGPLGGLSASRTQEPTSTVASSMTGMSSNDYSLWSSSVSYPLCT